MRLAHLRTLALALLAALALVACAPQTSSHDVGSSTPAARKTSDLPREAYATLALIRNNGPYPYDKDGMTFQNRERLLPTKARGYYREFTVPTPGARNRGARRIVTGGWPPEVYYYTADHYQSFTRIEGLP